MRQIGRELWVENCCVMGIVKLCLLLIMLFGGVILRDYPYSIICMLLLTSMEFTVLRLYGQIDYILPQTSWEKKRSVIIKSALVAGLYSAVNTAGYVWLACRRTDDSWDLELVLFLIYMTVVLFLYYFNYRAGLFCVGSGQIPKPETVEKTGRPENSEGPETVEKAGRRENSEGPEAVEKTDRPEQPGKPEDWHEYKGIGISTLASLLSVFSCIFYICYRFGNVRFPLALADYDAEIMLVLGGITLVLELREVNHCIQWMDYSEYREA